MTEKTGRKQLSKLGNFMILIVPSIGQINEVYQIFQTYANAAGQGQYKNGMDTKSGFESRL